MIYSSRPGLKFGATGIPNAINRVETAPMNLIYQVLPWPSLGTCPLRGFIPKLF